MTKEKTNKGNVRKDIFPRIKKERLIYCGPNIGFKASKDTTYIGGIPNMLKEEIEECEAIEKLFVPIEKYIETKKSLEEEGSIESLSYKAVQEFIRKKRGEN